MLFRGEYNFLSNFYPCTIRYKGKTYKSTEHAYQAQKFLSEDIREDIRKCDTPGQAKRLATQFDRREDWNGVKVSIMYELLCIKFDNPTLAKKLIDVGEPIIEHNTWGDTFWGVCEGTGKNTLGKLLERIRMEKMVFGP